MTLTKRIGHFLHEGMWIIDEAQLSVPHRIGLKSLRWLVITSNCFMRNNLPSYASALTYSCLLAFVPVLSIIYALARGFNWGDEIEMRLRSSMNDSFGGEISDKLFEFIHRYIENTHNGIFLGVGIVFLIFTVINMSSSIETAFNTIWDARTSRNVYRQIIDYTAVFVLFPLLLVVTSGFSVFLMTMAGQYADNVVISGTMYFFLRISPLVFATACFMLLFKYMPNTTVHWRSVILPGILSGILFQLLQFFYFQYQIKLSSYNAIYGSFAALPLFMLWLQLSWYICLAGGQLSYSIQHGADYMFTRDSANLSRHDHDALCLYIMSGVCKRFADGLPPLTYEQIAQDTKLPLHLVRGLMDEMLAAKLLNEVYSSAGKESAYQPAVDINHITPNYIIHQLDHQGQGHLTNSWTTSNDLWAQFSALRRDVLLAEGNTPIHLQAEVKQNETKLSDNQNAG